MGQHYPPIPARLAAALAGVTPDTIRDWRRRGLLEPVGGTSRKPLYAAADVIAAARAPKGRRLSPAA